MLDQVQLMREAFKATTHSKCEGRIVGCVIADAEGTILAQGTNAVPHGCSPFPERLLSPQKYAWVEHAERAAIYSAARSGVALDGATACSTLFPCVDCARALINSGISTVVSYSPDFSDPKWGEQFRLSLEMFEESGMDVQFLPEAARVS